MNVRTLISRAQSRIESHRRYSRAVAEINSLSARDLSDMRADRSEMLYWARKDILG
jgi:uncharacterized protein YjiS (DUF1127 family)